MTNKVKYVMCDNVLFQMPEDKFIEMLKFAVEGTADECFVEQYGQPLDIINLDGWGPDECKQYLVENAGASFDRFTSSTN